jgi:hypothetical protein
LQAGGQRFDPVSLHQQTPEGEQWVVVEKRSKNPYQSLKVLILAFADNSNT